MKNFKLFIILIGVFALTLASCSRVAPNYQGVLMKNFGQNGKADFTLVKGRVNTMMPGEELFQVPLFEQRGTFSTPLDLKASNNTDFTATPRYSYEVIEDRAVDVVFMVKRLDGGGDMMDAIEDNILEPRIDDMIKEYSRAYHTDSLMSDGGQLKFEQALQIAVGIEFKKRGFRLLTFQAQLEFSNKVKGKIDTRNEVDTNLSVLDSKILEQAKKNDLQTLITREQQIKSEGLTPEILQAMFIEKWDGHTPLYGDSPLFYKKTK